MRGPVVGIGLELIIIGNLRRKPGVALKDVVGDGGQDSCMFEHLSGGDEIVWATVFWPNRAQVRYTGGCALCRMPGRIIGPRDVVEINEWSCGRS